MLRKRIREYLWPVREENEPENGRNDAPPGQAAPSAWRINDIKKDRGKVNFDDLPRSVSARRLLDTQRNLISSALYQKNGEITASMIIRFGSYLKVSIPEKLIPAKYRESFVYYEDGEAKETTLGDSEGDAYLSDLPCSKEKMEEIISLIIKELESMYSECLKAEQNMGRTVPNADALPNYKTTTMKIAGSKAEFNRMRNREMFRSSVHSDARTVPITLSIPSILPGSSAIEEIATTTFLTAGRPPSIGARSTTSTVYPQFEQQKDPSVFRAFYPSTVSQESLRLPIYDHRKEILNCMDNKQLTIISGLTGTGKTTQVPLMVLDAHARLKKPCNIIVTQPRKLAAIGIAQRVCRERGWDVGKLVGYQVGLDRKTSPATRLTFCTTGVFLERIISDKHLNQYTHIFLDEVHERSQDTDLALMLVRQLLKETSQDVRVFLMSATAEVDKLKDYFLENNDFLRIHQPPGIISIRTNTHNVEEVFLDDLTAGSDLFAFDGRKPELTMDLMHFAARQLFQLLPIRPSESEAPREPNRFEPVLMFFPGLEHITDMASILHCIAKERGEAYDILVLHSTISREEQLKCIEPPPAGKRRFILSTNIAESSITIPYINYVFDFGLTKSLRVDPITKSCQLKLQWSSRSSCMQRKGRIGRTGPGMVYFFVPRLFYETELRQYPEPEILIAPLENSVLRVKMLGLAHMTPAEILVYLPDPPNLNEVDLAVLNLKEMGALTIEKDGKPAYEDGDVTHLGQLISGMPLDPRVAKFLVLCAMFGLLEEGVVIAAGFTVGTPFLWDKAKDAEFFVKMRRLYGGDTRCDALAIFHAFKEWSSRVERFPHRFREKEWCEKSLIDLARIKEMSALVRELYSRISRWGLNDERGLGTDSRGSVLPILFAGAFYQNIIVGAPNEDKLYGKILQYLDPLRTCVVPEIGYESKICGPLYDQQLKDMLPAAAAGKVLYGSRQAFFCFPRPASLSAADDAEIGLLQLRNSLNRRHVVRLVRQEPVDQSEMKLPAVAEGAVDLRFAVGDAEFPLILSDKLTSNDLLPVIISNITSARNIWLCLWDAESKETHTLVDRLLAGYPNSEFVREVSSGELKVGEAYISHKPGTNETERVVLLDKPDISGRVHVFMMDIGVFDHVPLDFMHVLPDKMRSIPRGSFQFVLTGLRFSASHEERIKDFFKKVLAQQDAIIEMQIFSVIDGVVHGDLFYKSRCTGGHRIHLNDQLVKLGYAQPGRESYISKEDHKRRKVGHCMVDPVENLPVIAPIRTKGLSETVEVGPIEFPCHARLVTLTGSRTPVFINSCSLNGFPCDPYPQDGGLPLRAYVAATLNHPTKTADKLTASITTAVPCLPGLLGVVVLLFAPRAVLRCLDGQLKSVLTGLGPFPGRPHSFYPDGEIHLSLDGNITRDDLVMINQLRSMMNYFLRRVRGDDEIVLTLTQIQEQCHTRLVSLISKFRSLIPYRSGFSTMKWDEEAGFDDERAVAEQIFLSPLTIPTEIPEHDSFCENMQLHEQAKLRMEDIAKGILDCARGSARGGYCKLCDQVLRDADEVLEHVFSESHQKVESRFYPCEVFAERFGPKGRR